VHQNQTAASSVSSLLKKRQRQQRVSNNVKPGQECWQVERRWTRSSWDTIATQTCRGTWSSLDSGLPRSHSPPCTTTHAARRYSDSLESTITTELYISTSQSIIFPMKVFFPRYFRSSAVSLHTNMEDFTAVSNKRKRNYKASICTKRVTFSDLRLCFKNLSDLLWL